MAHLLMTLQIHRITQISWHYKIVSFTKSVSCVYLGQINDAYSFLINRMIIEMHFYNFRFKITGFWAELEDFILLLSSYSISGSPQIREVMMNISWRARAMGWSCELLWEIEYLENCQLIFKKIQLYILSVIIYYKF